MSYVFEANDTTLWSPGLRVGALFVHLAECLADLEGKDTGLSKMASDYYIIDIDAFAAFVQSLLQDPSFGNPVFGELTQGFVAVSLVMLDRAGVAMPVMDSAAQQLVELTSSIASKMPV